MTRPSTAAPILAVLTVVLPVVLLVAYVAGFFALGERSWAMNLHVLEKREVRAFPSKFLVEIYRPAVWLESTFTGVEIAPVYWPWRSEFDEPDESEEVDESDGMEEES